MRPEEKPAASPELASRLLAPTWDTTNDIELECEATNVQGAVCLEGLPPSPSQNQCADEHIVLRGYQVPALEAAKSSRDNFI